MLIIVGTTVTVSLDRFEINSYRKMVNDIKLLDDQISNYYLKYEALPLLRDNNNSPIKYTYTSIDNNDYYIIDLSAMSGISLNYGKEGYNSPNTSTDVYVIEINSRTVYYVKGIEMNDALYHTLPKTDMIDTSRLTAPKIEIVEGEQNDEGKYTTSVTISFIPGIHKTKEVTTTHSIDKIDPNTDTIIETISSGNISSLTDNLYELSQPGTFKVTITSTVVGESPRTKEYNIVSIYES